MSNNNHMIVAKETIEKCLPVMAAIWFFVVIDSYLVWTSLAPVMHFIPAILVVWGTVQISNKLSLSCNRRVLFICILIYYFWIVISFCNEVGQFVKRSTDYVPMLCIVLWPNDLLLRIYKIMGNKCLSFAYVNSTWTFNHMKETWDELYKTNKLIILYPPCSISLYREAAKNDNRQNNLIFFSSKK